LLFAALLGELEVVDGGRARSVSLLRANRIMHAHRQIITLHARALGWKKSQRQILGVDQQFGWLTFWRCLICRSQDLDRVKLWSYFLSVFLCNSKANYCVYKFVTYFYNN
jgi:hypothetical protein